MLLSINNIGLGVNTMNAHQKNCLKAHFIVACQAENFMYVRPHQSASVNEHIEFHLNGFDKEYEKSGGKIGSPEHLKERREFAELTCQSMQNFTAQNEGYITELNTETKYISHTTGKTITVKSQNIFEPLYKSSMNIINFMMN